MTKIYHALLCRFIMKWFDYYSSWSSDVLRQFYSNHIFKLVPNPNDSIQFEFIYLSQYYLPVYPKLPNIGVILGYTL